jgi:hypothetical protein
MNEPIVSFTAYDMARLFVLLFALVAAILFVKRQAARDIADETPNRTWYLAVAFLFVLENCARGATILVDYFLKP